MFFPHNFRQSILRNALGRVRRNPWLYGVGGICCLALIVVVFWPKSAVPPVQKLSALVEVEKVSRGGISRVYNTNAVLVAVKSVQLFPEVDGRVTEILFQQGAQVRKGDVLVRLDDRLARAQVVEAEARLRQAQNEFENARALRKEKFLAPIAYEEKMTKRDVAAAELEIARFRLSQTLITAPFDGVVGLRKISEGATINRSQEITTVLVLDPLYVDFSVPESLMGGLESNAVVDVVVENGLPMEAQVEAVDTKSALGTHSVQVRALLDNPKQTLRPGQFASVTVYLNKDPEAVLIPVKAVLQEGDMYFVYTVIDNIAVRRVVSLGLREGGKVQVKEGLAVGEKIITVGQVRVQDGVTVKIADAQPKTESPSAKPFLEEGAKA